MTTQDGPEVTPPEKPQTQPKAILQVDLGRSANVDEPRLDLPSMTGSQRQTGSSFLSTDGTQVRMSTMPKTRSKRKNN